MKKLFVAIALGLLSMPLMAQTARKFTVNITPDGASNMQVFIPENPSGRALVACPGGGYSHLAMQHEGTDWAEYFNKQGIVYGVLTYRMPKGDRTIPMSDAANAVKMMRDSAAVWGLSPYDVGIMGSSAGGHLASTTATHGPVCDRPNFQILFYPVISMVEKETHKGSVVNFLGDGRSDEKLAKEFTNYQQVNRHETPRAILFMTADDTAVPIMTNGLPYYNALRKNGIPAAMHVYPEGGHGFGFRSTFAYHDVLLAELTQWLKSLPSPKADAVRVACIGNSITDGSGIDYVDANGYPAQLQKILGNGYFVRNFGYSARTMLNNGNRPYMKEQKWQDAKAFNPNIVVIKLGTNDSKPLNWDKHSKEFTKDMQQMIDELGKLEAKPTIYLCTPIKARTYNSTLPNAIRDSVLVADIIPAIEKVAKKNKLQLIDLRPLIDPKGKNMNRDGIHPNKAGAGLMAKKIAETIQGKTSSAKK